MRREYDFSKGTRGKHVGKRVRIVGDRSSRRRPDTASRILQTIERDLKGRKDFNAVWTDLKRTERQSLRADWLKKIRTILADQLTSS